MPTTTSRTSKELLAFALKELADADALLKKRTKELEDARERANATSGLSQAAELAFNNADADYRLLYEKAEATEAEEIPSPEVVAAARNVLDEAEEAAKAVGQSRKPIDQAVTAAGKCLPQVETAVARLEKARSDLDDAADKAPRGSKSGFRNAANSLASPHKELETLLGRLRTNHQDAEDDLKKAPKLPALDRLRDLVGKLEHEPGAAGTKPGAKEPAVDEAELERLRKERDAAEIRWRQVPEVERTAQANLRAKETALAEAKRFLDYATAGRDQAEQSFIQRIDLGAPNAEGIVEATVIFVNDAPPEGYQVRWTFEAGALEESVGTVIRIKTQGVPTGNYTLEAHLEAV